MKIKKTLAIILTFILCFSVLTVVFADETAEVPEGYIPIYTAEDLYNIRNNLAGKYILMNDIDLSTYENWEPIGTSETPFNGVLDGNNYVISKMSINNRTNYVGLFGCLNSAEIKNLIIKDSKIEIDTEEIILVGLISGQAIDSIISNCISSGMINIESKGSVNAGGIVGISWNNGSNSNDYGINNCSNATEISVVGQEADEAEIKDIYAGGIAGSSNAVILQCSNEGNINLSNYDSKAIFVDVSAGGICGYTRGNIKDCYNLGSINATGVDSATAGGISGYWESHNSISNLYNMGAVVSCSTADDGLEFHGALIGYEEGVVYPDTESEPSEVVLSDCYYINNGLPANGFLGSCSTDNVKMLTEEEFKNQESFVVFDFENIWIMDEKLGYPVFKWEYEKEISEPSTNESTTKITTAKPTEPVTNLVTEPSTAEDTSLPVLETTTQPETEVNPTTEPVTEPSIKEPSTATTTVPSTEPDDKVEECWLINLLKKIIRFFEWIFNVFGC